MLRADRASELREEAIPYQYTDTGTGTGVVDRYRHRDRYRDRYRYRWGGRARCWLLSVRTLVSVRRRVLWLCEENSSVLVCVLWWGDRAAYLVPVQRVGSIREYSLSCRTE